jgi:equilibrative nucleoside transporter 1/2/3
MCTFPLLVSFYPADSKTGQNLPSLLSTVYCFVQLIFLGVAQRQVGKVRMTLP